jgi:hypothetical protein
MLTASLNQSLMRDMRHSKVENDVFLLPAKALHKIEWRLDTYETVRSEMIECRRSASRLVEGRRRRVVGL